MKTLEVPEWITWERIPVRQGEAGGKSVASWGNEVVPSMEPRVWENSWKTEVDSREGFQLRLGINNGHVIGDQGE